MYFNNNFLNKILCSLKTAPYEIFCYIKTSFTEGIGKLKEGLKSLYFFFMDAQITRLGSNSKRYG